MQTFDIPAAKINEAQRSLARANKRLAAAGISEQFTATYAPYSKVVLDTAGVPVLVERVKVTLSRPSIAFSGYSFLATVEEAAPGTFLAYTAPGVTLYGWRPTSMNCEHCNKKRSRSKVYVIEGPDGTRKTVGKTCVELYTGMSPEGLFALEWNDFGKHHDDDWEANGATFGPRVYNADRVIQLTAHFVKEFGYQPTLYMDSTKHRVVTALTATDPVHRTQAQDDLMAADAYDAGHYREAMRSEFATSSSDWAQNVSALLDLEWLQEKHVGVLASGVSAIVKNEEKAVQEADLLNEFYSYAGAQFNVEATATEVKRITDNYSYYGGSYYRVTLHTDLGYVLVWKTSRSDVPPVGERFMFFGRVKNHNEWRGRKTTNVTRLKWYQV